ncbi:MAG: hypothetical protein AAB373_04150 [Patescibacteria group bacterium]
MDKPVHELDLSDFADEVGNHGQHAAAGSLDGIYDGFRSFSVLLNQKAFALNGLAYKYEDSKVRADIESIVTAVFGELIVLLGKTEGEFFEARAMINNEQQKEILWKLRILCGLMKKEIVEALSSIKSENPILVMQDLLNIENNSIDIAAKWGGTNIEEFKVAVIESEVLASIDRATSNYGGEMAMAA